MRASDITTMTTPLKVRLMMMCLLSILGGIMILTESTVPTAADEAPLETNQYDLLMDTRGPVFEDGGLVIITIMVPEESYVTVEVEEPTGDRILLESAYTVNGMAVIQIRLQENPIEGEYLIYACAVSQEGEDQAMTSGSFEVEEDDSSGWEPVMPDATVAFLGTAVIFGAVVLSGRWWEPWRFALVSLFVPLYTRIRPENLEDSVVRAEILGYVRHHPGANYSTIKRDLQLSNGQLTHHLKMLLDAFRIKSVNHGNRKLFYPKNYSIPFNSIHAPRSHEIQRTILDILQHNPGLNQKEIVRILDRDRKTVSIHLNSLLKRGLIRLDKKGRENIYSIIPPPQIPYL